jgi:phosphoesterase RecJ-like protein
MTYTKADEIQKLINDAKHIVVLQADNPDGDSLASALALEHILSDMNKKVSLYCGVDISSYMHYIPGHDRVTKDLPNDFDLSILVDCSSATLLEQLGKTNQMGALRTRPMIILDHHSSENDIPVTNTALIDATAVATGEVIYQLAKQLSWKVTTETANLLSTSILSDSLGLTVESVTARSIHTLADLVEYGANLAELEIKRRASMVKPLEIIAYKGKLLQRIEYFADKKLALVVIPWDEIQKFSPLYNPAVLVLEELRIAEGVKLSVVIKLYPDGKITGKLRSNQGAPVAGQLSQHFGGGGHANAAGFKTFDWKFDELKTELIKEATRLLGDIQ